MAENAPNTTLPDPAELTDFLDAGYVPEWSVPANGRPRLTLRWAPAAVTTTAPEAPEEEEEEDAEEETEEHEEEEEAAEAAAATSTNPTHANRFAFQYVPAERAWLAAALIGEHPAAHCGIPDPLWSRLARRHAAEIAGRVLAGVQYAPRPKRTGRSLKQEYLRNAEWYDAGEAPVWFAGKVMKRETFLAGGWGTKGGEEGEEEVEVEVEEEDEEEMEEEETEE
ncbi:hypothetical protein BU16DRAFT_568276 [Lophium mytilinum]|uniref:Uncharacterized protein n=1 Tax=Lophium mytilinum TaxID=390894 RepID=A0A6A6Q8X1_9PEZI|nr:hypothetical protein BU16DRAFT_568276 [Lophium mytilinum]